MNEYLKLIMMLKVAYENLFVLHHNVSGPVWFPTHEKLAEYYGMIGDMADDVTEIGISIGVKEPIITECLAVSPALPVADRDERTTYTEARNMFTGLMAQFQTAEQSLSGQYADVVNKLQEYRETLRKEADYKLARAIGVAPVEAPPVSPPSVMDDEDEDM